MSHRDKIIQLLLVIILLIASFITGLNYRPLNKVEMQFDSMVYRTKLDSLNHIIQANKDTIQALSNQKQKVRTKYVQIYLNLDSTNYDEILWEHGLLDDTTVNIPDSSIVLFRLVQGAEARALNIIQEIEIKKLHAIISDMEEIRQNDSTAIAFLIQDNNKLNEAILNVSAELTSCKIRLDKIEGTKRSNGFKTAAIGFVGFIGGVFIGLLN